MDLGLLPPYLFFNFVVVPHLATFVFCNFQIDLLPIFPLVCLTRQDSNPQTLDRESSSLTTRPD